jgi:hypothetical protein
MIMKSIIMSILSLLVVSSSLKGQATLNADAGVDTNYCIYNDTIVLGGKPTARDGIEPYTYDWLMYSKTTGNVISILSELGENHKVNPAIPPSEFTGRNINDIVIVKVTVTDASHSIISDSSIIGISVIKYMHLMLCGRIVHKDSVQLGLCNIYQGIRPFSFHWTPERDISNPYIENPMVKPDTITSYNVEVTDNIGCSAVDGILVYVDKQTNIENWNTNSEYIKFQNPVSEGDYIYFNNDLIGGILILSTINGVILYQKIIESDSLNIGDIIRSKGVFLYMVVAQNNRRFTGKIIRK